MRALVIALAGAIVCGGCGDDDDGTGDAAVADANDLADAAGDAITTSTPEAPELPRMTPCPQGWRDVVAVADYHHCEPWPATGRALCTGDEAHFPGRAGCEAIGSACPAGDWATDLPVTGSILYVRPGASSGTGTQASPHNSISAALSGAARGTIVALAKGAYAEAVVINASVTLWGACPGGTIVSGSTGAVAAIEINSPASAVIRNLEVRPIADLPGIQLNAAASLELDRVLVSGASEVGIYSEGVLRGNRIVVRDTTAGPLSALGGLMLFTPATLSQVVVERSDRAGIAIAGASAEIALDDVAIDHVRQYGLGNPGPALDISSEARLVASRVVAEHAVGVGVRTRGARSRTTITDLVVRDIARTNPVFLANAASAESGASLTVRRALAERAPLGGIGAFGATTTMTLEDVVVRDTDELAVSGENLTAVRLYIERTGGGGILAAGTVSDVIVDDVRGDPRGGLGYGVVVTKGTLALNRARITRTRGLALSAWGSTLNASDIVIDGVRELACASSTCTAYSGYGAGIAAVRGATIDVRRFRVARSVLCGVHLLTRDSVDLHEGTIEHNPIGANVQNSAFDVARLSDRVIFRDNGINLESIALLPPPPPPGVAP